MRLTLTEGWPSLVDTLEVQDAAGALRWTVRAKTLALRDRLSLRDPAGSETAWLQAGWTGGYALHTAAGCLASIGDGRVRLAADGAEFTITGDVAGREYKVADRQRVLVTVSRSFFSFTDRYGLDVPVDSEVLVAVGIAVALHRDATRSR